MKKILTIILSVLFCFCALSGCRSGETSEEFARTKIEECSSIIIPEECVAVNIYADTDFHPGGRSLFAVFIFENEPSEWLNENNFETQDADKILSISQGYKDNFIASGLKKGLIQSKYLPTINSEFIWAQSQITSFLYYTQTKILVVYVQQI